jgi:hypothetical protein
MCLFFFDENLCLLDSLNLKSPYKEKGVFRWKGSKEDCSLILEIMLSCQNKDQFLYAIECEPELLKSESFDKSLYYWDLKTIICSSLFFLLEKEKEEQKNRPFSSDVIYSNYNIIISLLISPYWSNDVTLLLKHNNFLKILSKKTEVLLLVIRQNFLFHINYKHKSEYSHVIENFFKLLEFKKSSIFILKEKVFQEKNSKFIIKFIDLLPIYLCLLQLEKNRKKNL